jgi:hypothetical protein
VRPDPGLQRRTDCGTEDKLYDKGHCARCSLRRRARVLLADPAGAIPPALAGVLEAITATRQLRVALNWLRQGGGAALLADVAAGQLPLTHEALDACPRRNAADYLRHMLTASGALPQRDEHLARTEQWLHGLLTGIKPAEDRKLVQAYATWQVMRRLRESTGHALTGAREWILAGQIRDLVTSAVAGLPAELLFRTKGRLAIDILTRGLRRGVLLDFVCGDEAYGSCTDLREFCEGRDRATAAP